VADRTYDAQRLVKSYCGMGFNLAHSSIHKDGSSAIGHGDPHARSPTINVNPSRLALLREVFTKDLATS